MMKAIDLLSKNDRKALKVALRERKALCVEREWAPAGYCLRAFTVPASSVWEQYHTKMILRVEGERRGMKTTQNFISVEEMEEYFTWTIDRQS